MNEPTAGAPLSPAQRTALRNRLTEERESTTTQISALTRDLGGIIEASTSVATDDEHDPEGATIAFERAQVAALLTRARERLVDLDRALEQLDAGTYGRCERCGLSIAADRLAARPAARTCINCASGRSNRTA